MNKSQVSILLAANVFRYYGLCYVPTSGVKVGDVLVVGGIAALRFAPNDFEGKLETISHNAGGDIECLTIAIVAGEMVSSKSGESSIVMVGPTVLHLFHKEPIFNGWATYQDKEGLTVDVTKVTDRSIVYTDHTNQTRRMSRDEFLAHHTESEL